MYIYIYIYIHIYIYIYTYIYIYICNKQNPAIIQVRATLIKIIKNTCEPSKPLKVFLKKLQI